MGVYDRLSSLNKQASPSPPPPKNQEIAVYKGSSPKKRGTVVSSNRDTMTPRHQQKNPSSDNTTIIEQIRHGVKQLGKEAATHRFTVEEKKALSKIIFTYKTQNIRTSENEIARIAINFIIADYDQHGKKSVLQQALDALHQ